MANNTSLDPLVITPTSITPVSRVLRTPMSERLLESGFDDEESIKRRDQSGLIGYIAKLEAENYDLQHHLGVLILEKKEWDSKHERMKALTESDELMHIHYRAAMASASVEAQKREENLKKLLGVEKECVASIEKAMSKMRAECAEMKIASESKLAEARILMEDAQKKSEESETKLHAAESLESEANRYHQAAERSLHEVEAREDELMRRVESFKSDSDAKEKDIVRERQSLSVKQRSLQLSQEGLLYSQNLLNQREDYIFSRTEELNRKEKILEDSKVKIDEELKSFIEEKHMLEINAASLKAREEDIEKRKLDLDKREEDLQILQQKLERKEYDGFQQAVDHHEASIKVRRFEFEAEKELKRKLVDEELEAKRRAWELREVDLRQTEDLIMEQEYDWGIKYRYLADKEKDYAERLNILEEKEKNLIVTEEAAELNKYLLQKEKEEINKLKLSVQDSMHLLEERRKELANTEEKIETMRRETDELMILATCLKEEIDMIRTQKQDVDVQSDELKAEKAKFEAEWELIDEKREELKNQAELIAEERISIFKFLKDERDSLKAEKDAMLEQYKHDLESLSRDRETLLHEIENERSDWFSKLQKERANILNDIDIQKREFEKFVNKRNEETESYLRERKEILDEEKKKELQNISLLREMALVETEQVKSEMEKLAAERFEISLDREQREKEWIELNNTIEELNLQRHKLEKQRKLLHTDREQILAEIEQMKKLDDSKDQSSTPSSRLKRSADTELDQTQSDKKRKLLKDFIRTPSEDTVQIRRNEPQGHNQAHCRTEETMVYIDKIIRIHEVTSMEDEVAVLEGQETVR
ncbi:protein CROWDED NUCLEI 4-like [Impatiens glandulifera]|uniref:protein CROWDED NUCLEI 4-like n=1 Tax=Impatiens glandulifera TaxID=253017 RepID=UPI001FB171F0|nr:protein CROWDED NUCLEI 4-like [Impatiens glandulifera]